MKQLIGSSNLFVMQVEMDVYTALKKVLMFVYRNITSDCTAVKSWEHMLR